MGKKCTQPRAALAFWSRYSRGSQNEKPRIGYSGTEVAPLKFGGNVFGWTADQRPSFRLLDAFVAAGLNLIDTADVYSRLAPGNCGESETLHSDHPKGRVRNHTEVALANLSNASWRNACGEVQILSMKVASPRKNSSSARTEWKQIRTYAQLQEQLHRDLLAQHPEWIDADGSSPACDSYDERLAELISWFESAARKSIAEVI